MLKNIARLEQVVRGQEIHLTCNPDCPTDILKEAVFNIFKFIGQIEDSARAQQEEQEAAMRDAVEPFESIPEEPLEEV